MYYFMCVMLHSDVDCRFTPRSEKNKGNKLGIIDQPRFHADMQCKVRNKNVSLSRH